jgi:hypothetical protein
MFPVEKLRVSIYFQVSCISFRFATNNAAFASLNIIFFTNNSNFMSAPNALQLVRIFNKTGLIFSLYMMIQTQTTDTSNIL